MSLGDFTPGDTIYFNFTSLDVAATPAVPANTAGVTVSVYKDDSTTQSTDGVTFTGGFDSVTGLNNVKINTASNATFYAAGHDFQAVITAGTVNAVALTGYVLGSFTLQAVSSVAVLNTINTNVGTVSTNVNTTSTNVNTVSTNVNTISSNVNTVSTNVTATPGLVWEVLLASHTNTGTTGKQLGDIATGSAPTAAAIANTVWETSQASHTNAGTFGKYLDAQVSLVSTQTSVNTISTNVNTVSTNVNTVSTNVNTVSTNVNAVYTKLNAVSLVVNTINTNVSGIPDAVWAAVVAEVANDTDLRLSMGKMMRGVFERLFNLISQTASAQDMYNDAGDTVKITMPVSDDGTTQLKGRSA